MKYHHSSFFAIFLIFWAFSSKASIRVPIFKNPGSDYRWERTDSTFALVNNNRVVWQLNFSRRQDKPYFYPLRVNGKDLALDRPADHPWHRGLWFSWKYINKVNYWEENKTGVADGRSKIVGVEIQAGKDFGALIQIQLEYGPNGKSSILNETRIMTISKPDVKGNYLIDWNMTFKSKDSALLFDRSPPLKHGGKIFWGYAGLSYRAAESLTKHVFTSSSGWTNSKKFIGEPGDAGWIDMGATVDSASKSLGGITIFDHKQNPRSPSPWYIWFEPGKYAFFTPAVLYNQPLELPPYSEMELKYRVYIHSGAALDKKLNKINKQFQRGH